MIDQTYPVDEKYAFLISANEDLEAEAYEEMLAKNGVSVIKKDFVPSGSIATILAANTNVGFNLYVLKENLDHAKDLLYRFENDPIEYDSTYASFNEKPRINYVKMYVQLLGFFGIPFLIALFSMILKVVKKFQ